MLNVSGIFLYSAGGIYVDTTLKFYYFTTYTLVTRRYYSVASRRSHSKQNGALTPVHDACSCSSSSDGSERGKERTQGRRAVGITATRYTAVVGRLWQYLEEEGKHKVRSMYRSDDCCIIEGQGAITRRRRRTWQQPTTENVPIFIQHARTRLLT